MTYARSFFFRTFAAGNKIKQFYELLVEESLRREDVDTLSKENMKNLHEIMQSFRFSNVCYWSYLTRTSLEIVLSIGKIFAQLSSTCDATQIHLVLKSGTAKGAYG